MSEGRAFCLTLDLEDDWHFDDPSLDHRIFEYLDDFLALVDELDVPISVFVVGETLEKYPEEVDRMRSALDCEFHLHSYRHDLSKSYDFETEVRLGKRAYRDYFGRDPIGYRAPQGNIEPHEFGVLEELGFDFDSSVFPSYRPGKYNNLDAPTEPYIPDGVDSLVEIPVGAFLGLRIPVSLSYFKLFGKPLSTYLTVAPLPDALVYNVHLHDLYRTASHDELDAPKRWIMKRNLDRAESMFRTNVSTILSRGFEPTTMTEMYHTFEGRGDDEQTRRGNQELHVRP